MKSSSPERRPDVEVREVETELLVLDRRDGKIHQFNHSAALVWELCDGRHSVEEITAQVATAYSAPVDTVKLDVTAIVEQFMTLGLLVTIESCKGE